jgi:hypothetical protein
MARSVWLRNDAAREGFQNDGTICFPLGRFPLRPATPVPSTFEDALRRFYPDIRRLLNSHRAPGIALLVEGAHGLEATAWLPAEEDAVNPVIVGRHSTAEIFLPSDPALSLRHVVVIVRREAGGGVSFRVLDLRTPTAFEDEQGRSLRALESAGPTMVRFASYALLLFPTLDTDEPWPEDAGEGWARVPERVYLESVSADPGSWSRPGAAVVRACASHADRSAPTTSVVAFPGPAFLSPAPADPASGACDAGSARGEIRIRDPQGGGSLLLDAEAARRGALIGRYDRCDGYGLPCLAAHWLSRVHLLVVESGSGLWAIDTASRNGTWYGSETIRRLRLEPGRELWLAKHVRVEWCPFH